MESTISVLQSELSRLATQIAQKNTEIANKEGEITTLETNISSTQRYITDLETQRLSWINNYNYWNSEVNRLGGLETTAGQEANFHLSNYTSDRNKLIAAGRSDVPSNPDASNIVTQINTLITTITNELNALPTAIANTG